MFLTNFYFKESCLFPEDILGALNHLMKLNKGIGLIDDIDDLKNKRIRGSGELLVNHINLNSSDVVKPLKSRLDQLSEKIRNNKNFLTSLDTSDILESKLFTNLVKKFFLNNQLSQILEDINPLAEVSHKRKVCSFGVGAIDRNRASLKIREIHPSHFGRICPIETTEGKNAGLILSFAKDIQLNENGFIETPFYLRLILVVIKIFKYV